MVAKLAFRPDVLKQIIGISYLNGLTFLLDELMRNIQHGKNINNDNLFITIFSL